MAAAVDIHAAGGALEYTAVAEFDMSTGQYRIVHVGATANGVKVVSAAGIKVSGVLQNKPSSGRAARIRTHGITKLVAGAAITLNANLTADAAGYAVTAVGSNYIGIALETVVTSGTFKALISQHIT